MPAHLYTIPAGRDLPDAHEVPEGFPYLLDNANGGRTMLVNNGGVWQSVAPLGSVVTATFAATIPAQPDPAGGVQDIDAGIGGLPGLAFTLPEVAAGNPGAPIVLLEAWSNLAGITTPNDVLGIHVLVSNSVSTPSALIKVEEANLYWGPDGYNRAAIFQPYTTEDLDVTLQAGFQITVTITVGANYSNPEPAYVGVTLVFGPGLL